MQTFEVKYTHHKTTQGFETWYSHRCFVMVIFAANKKLQGVDMSDKMKWILQK
jgi:hypothetical protein